MRRSTAFPFQPLMSPNDREVRVGVKSFGNTLLRRANNCRSTSGKELRLLAPLQHQNAFARFGEAQRRDGTPNSDPTTIASKAVATVQKVSAKIGFGLSLLS
jgi:hypothetical protein